jgi:predicted DNA binding CopG/RHH family protein
LTLSQRSNKCKRKKLKEMVKKMAKQNRDIRIQVRVTEEELERINEYARKLQLAESTMVRNLLLVGLDNADFMQKFGILNIVGFFKQNQIKPMDILQLANDIV